MIDQIKGCQVQSTFCALSSISIHVQLEMRSTNYKRIGRYLKVSEIWGDGESEGDQTWHDKEKRRESNFEGASGRRVPGLVTIAIANTHALT